MLRLMETFVKCLQLRFGHVWKVMLSYMTSSLFVCANKLYPLWLKIYDVPDQSEVIVFNELPLQNAGVHSDPRCCKKFCNICRIQRVVFYINQAKFSIDLAHLTFSHRMICDAIVAAWLRGVEVRIVADPQMLNVRGSVFIRLWAMGVPVRVAPPVIVMHHKLCIVDADEGILRLWHQKGYVMTGSLNWTHQGTFRNYENVIVTSNRELCNAYADIFEDLWHLCPPLTLNNIHESIDLYAAD